jgi:hypothetical protein
MRIGATAAVETSPELLKLIAAGERRVSIRAGLP